MRGPKLEVSRLTGAMAAADSIVIVSGHEYDSKNRANNRVLARSNEPSRVAEAVGAINPDLYGTRMDWMTLGGPSIVFLDGNEVLACITCLDQTDWLRCDGIWDGDAPQRDKGEALSRLLANLAGKTVSDRLGTGETANSIATDIRREFGLTPMAVGLAMKRGGLSTIDAHAAARSTMTGQELKAHRKLKDRYWDELKSTEAH